MPLTPPSADALHSFVGTVHPVTGVLYPPPGMQPYWEWLVGAVHLLSESSAGQLKVWAAGDLPEGVWIAAGRATIGSKAVAYEGGTLSLAAFNNATAHLWLAESGGDAVVEAGAAGDGWPTASHIRLAEVTLESGRVTAVLDRRWEAAFRG